MTDLIAHLPDTYEGNLGLLGAILYMASYTLLAGRRLSGDSVPYFLLNLAAATLVLISLNTSFNFASLMIQAFWILVSVLSIAVRLRRSRPSHRLRPLR
ncbi:CBU_0592 family membrane protein [Jannaschia marina]|uniref:CBU_0592 family membrane protein n=1 Tax=Jannaschia marina TaxID=2741674 RepID=UPI0015C8D11D|nr:hypothetical protein [Jannaschia marina]